MNVPLSITTAVVLARGLGTRMQRAAEDAVGDHQRAAADRGAKALMPLGGHTLLDHGLSALADAGLSRVVLVVAPDHGAFVDHFARRPLSRLRIDFAVQAAPLGTADAVRACAPAVGADPFVLLNADNYYPSHAVRALARAGAHAMGGFSPHSVAAGGNVPLDRVWRYAFVWCDPDGFLTDIVEKPAPSAFGAMPALVSMNLWALGSSVFEACARIAPSPRGELELADAIRVLVKDMGERVRVVAVRGPVLDLSVRGDIAAVERLLRGHEVVL